MHLKKYYIKFNVKTRYNIYVLKDYRKCFNEMSEMFGWLFFANLSRFSSFFTSTYITMANIDRPFRRYIYTL